MPVPEQRSGIVFFKVMDPLFQRMQNVIAQCAMLIAYHPRWDEVDYAPCPLFSRFLDTSIIVPRFPDADPLAHAATIRNICRNEKPCIVVPGRRFDRHGTRHGRGHGWYDRFLLALPANWPRIGIADILQLSPTPLERQAWDEPVDWIVIRDGSSWRVIETLARHF